MKGKNKGINTVSGFAGPNLPKPAYVRNKDLMQVDTEKGGSTAYVAKEGMPVSFEPIKSPKSKTLSQIARSIKHG